MTNKMKVRLKNGKNNKVHILLDGEYKMTVDGDFCLLASLYDGKEITEEELLLLESEVNVRRAFNKASELLSRRDHSEKELLFKLRQKGFSEGAEEAVEKLRGYGYVDDRRFAFSYAAELKELKHFGKRRIEQELFKKGIERSVISEVVSSLEFDENELATLITRKYSKNLDTEKGVQKTINALVRAGYGYGEIKDALAVLAEGEGDFSNE